MRRALSGLVCAGLIAFAGLVPAPAAARSSVDPGQVAISVARWLEQGHYTREKLDDKMARRFLQTYLTTLDYNKLYFTQQDVDEFEGKYATTLGDSVLRGELGPAREIFARFRQRVEDRVARNKKLAQKKYTFDSNRTVEINRQDASWPKNQEEADQDLAESHRSGASQGRPCGTQTQTSAGNGDPALRSGPAQCPRDGG